MTGLSRASAMSGGRAALRRLLPTWLGALAIYGIQFLFCGTTWFFPDDPLAFRVYNGQAKLTDLPPQSQFTLEGVLSCKLGGLIAAKGLDVATVALRYQVCVMLVLLAVLSFGVLSRKATTAGALGILAATSIAKVNLAWVMKPDTLLFSFLLLGVWLFDSPLSAIALMCAGLCHPSQAVIGALAMTGVFGVVRNTAPFQSLRSIRVPPLWALAGSMAGYVLNGWYQKEYFPGAMTRQMYGQHNRADIIVNGLPFTGEFLLVHAAALLLVAIAIWGFGGAKPLPRWGTAAIAAYFVCAAALGLYLTYDHSRVTYIALMPGIAALLTHYREEFETAFRRRPRAMILGALVLMALPELVSNGWRAFSYPGTGEAMNSLRLWLREVLHSHPQP